MSGKILIALVLVTLGFALAQTRLNQNQVPTAVPGILSGTFQSMSTVVPCKPGSLFFATDSPDGQWIYGCNNLKYWVQLLNIGSSGALQVVGGSLDVNMATVPLIFKPNTFDGFNTFDNGLSLLTGKVRPVCSADYRGTFWFTKSDATRDDVSVCVYNGTNYGWIDLY